MLQVVWFKRDLRLGDHQPLTSAAQAGPVLPLWVDEPGLWAQPDASDRQRAYALQSLSALAEAVAGHGGQLAVWHGDVIECLDRLRQAVGPFVLRSHEETGNGWTFARDRAVARWCRAHGIAWHEDPCNAVVRRLDSRDRWSAHWARRMEAPPLPAPADIRWSALPTLFTAPDRPLGWSLPNGPNAQALLFSGSAVQGGQGGERAAQDLLHDFLYRRGQDYRRAMSSPAPAFEACSRLSPALAWGQISVRQTVHAAWQRRRELLDLPREIRPPGWLEAVKSFESRLHWRCHFVQKLESEPEIEWRNVNRGFDGLRDEGPMAGESLRLLSAWREGRTGWPMVDACMRSLNATGWLNFRMRAMLMSVATGPLWLHWREPGLHLARQFTDYEPGIHWSQCQMQSGVTGINTVRMYNPIKQGHDQDPDGDFIRRWVPELAGLRGPLVHEPWRLPSPPADYPAPVVDLQAALRQARDRVHQRKASLQAQREARRVYAMHGSRNPAREGVRRAVRSAARPGEGPPQASGGQLALDWG